MTSKSARAPKQQQERPGRGSGSRHVYDTLHREILSLKLGPGTPLDETQIARRFGMSRSPVREALSRLAAQHLVVMLPNRSTLVAPIDLMTFPRYVEALDLLQRINTRLAAQHRSSADLAEMERMATGFEESVEHYDHLAMSAMNKAFHMAIAEAGRNPYLCRQYSDLLDEGRRLLHLHFEYLARTEREYLLTDQHREMIAAIEARDVEAADRLAHAHTLQFHDRFMLFMKTNYATDFRFDLDDEEGGGHTGWLSTDGPARITRKTTPATKTSSAT